MKSGDCDRKREFDRSSREVDTCAGEFEAHTPYLYSTYEEEDEAVPNKYEKDHDPRGRSQ